MSSLDQLARPWPTIDTVQKALLQAEQESKYLRRLLRLLLDRQEREFDERRKKLAA